MMGHKICFYEEVLIIIPKLSLLLLLIWSPESNKVPMDLARRGNTTNGKSNQTCIAGIRENVLTVFNNFQTT